MMMMMGWGIPFWEKPTMTKFGVHTREGGNLGRAEAGSWLMRKAKKEDDKQGRREEEGCGRVGGANGGWGMG